MSEQTFAALEQAVRDHFADEFSEESGMATGWVVQVAGVLGADADSSAHLRIWPEDQPIHVSLGITDYLHLRVRQLAISDDDE